MALPIEMLIDELVIIVVQRCPHNFLDKTIDFLLTVYLDSNIIIDNLQYQFIVIKYEV